MTLLPDQYELLRPFDAEYSCDGTAKENATNSEMVDRRHVLVVPRYTALKIAESPRALAKSFGNPKSAKILSYTDNDVERKLGLRDAPVDPIALREHCENPRKHSFSPKVWQVLTLDSPIEALKLLPEGGKYVAVLYNDRTCAGYTAYSSLDQVKGLEMLKVRKAPQEGEHEIFLVVIYESPYSAYGEAEMSGEEMVSFMDGRNCHFLQDGIFNDVGDHTYATQVARRYSDNGQRLVDERRLAAMQEDELVSLAIRKHRHPKLDVIIAVFGAMSSSGQETTGAYSLRIIMVGVCGSEKGSSSALSRRKRDNGETQRTRTLGLTGATSSLSPSPSF